MANPQEVKKAIDDMNSMIEQRKLMDAFEKYYADDVTMQENEEEPRVGKETNRKSEQAFSDGLTRFVSKVLGVATGEDLSIVEWDMDFDHKEWGKSKRRQVAVQRWKNGKIINERFYYDNSKS